MLAGGTRSRRRPDMGERPPHDRSTRRVSPANTPTSFFPLTQRFLDWVASKARPRRPLQATARTPRAAAADLHRRLAAAADARAAHLARVTAAAAQTSLRSAEAAVRRAGRAADEAAASVRRAEARRAAAERRATAAAARVTALKLRGKVVNAGEAAATAAARTIQAEWRAFAATHRPTSRLAAAFVDTGVLMAEAEPEEAEEEPEAASPPHSPPPPAAVLLVPGASPPPRRTPFDDFADVLRSSSTLLATHSLLTRLEERVHGRPPTTASRPPSRYHPREFLCAFMLLTHPDVVFSRATGARETALTKAAARLRGATVDAVAAWLPAGVLPPRAAEFASPTPPSQRAAIAAFDDAWRAYEAAFRAWKVADAACLEADLASAAVGLESSRLAVEAARAAAAAATTSDDSDAPRAPRRVATADDAAELAAAVERDVALLRERAAAVAGPAAAARVDAAVAAARARAAADAGAGADTPPMLPPTRVERITWSVITGESSVEARASAAVWASAVSGVALPPDAAAAAAAADAAASSAAAVSARTGDMFGDVDARALADAAADDARWAAVRLALERGGADRAPAAAAAALATTARRLLTLVPSLLAAGGAPSTAVAECGVLEEVAAFDAIQRELAPTDATPPCPLPGIALAPTLARLDAVVTCLRRLAAPSRDAELAAAAADSADALASARDGPALAAALATALRRADAGARVTVADSVSFYAAFLGHASLARLASASLLARHSAPPEPADDPDAAASSLPLTRAWLASACGKLAAVEAALPEPGSGATSEDDASSSRGSPPPRLQAGRAHPATPSPSPSSSCGALTEAAAAADNLPTLTAAPRSSWRAAARVGLVALASDRATSSYPLTTPVRLPELLAPLDAGLLAPARAELQTLAVCVAACLLTASRRSAAPTDNLIPRVRAILTAPDDPDLASTLADAVGDPSAVGEFRAGVDRLLRAGAPAERALSAGMVTALHARLLLPPGRGADAAVAAALARCGGACVATEVDALAARLAKGAAALEVAFGGVLEVLCDGLL